jgi:carboxylesterase type B
MILWGQSAGGGTVDAYSYANPSDPIVSGLVSQSGVISQTNRQNTSAFSAVAEKFGCSDSDGQVELSCMQAVDPIELRTFIRSSASPRFGPSADNVTLFENNTARAEQGLVAKVVSDRHPFLVADPTNAEHGL